jgi:hypothetical protein
MARQAPKFLDWNNACVSMTELAVLMDRDAVAMAA